ncbi:EF-hand protein (macronuclear) [Tetrahymena thermophila SB210]|uniref:EF-hand protein n=1 Tax=Tetrahymena thermophila (strain SB210) TaxID=312017 RepID=A4VF36_TETTS|nr:EF-hand protein [Tetrahymena thermophila SB210]EDK31214.2 EF-hand protein [Tetrahymena thermophila SB210]|eukprot:XP_001470653.2 EF-hand protein [Tetrahymena thermophila SB210]
MKSTSLSAIKTKQNLDDSLDQEDVDLKKLKRSRLMNKEVMDWAKKRSLSAIKKQYVHYPQDLKKIQEIKNVFLQIDKDGSRSLDKDEINEMFSKYDFYIDPDYLDQLFRIVDDDQDNALNWQEFKKCALNDNATRVFNFMMRKARERANQNKTERRPIQVVQDIKVEDMDNYEQYEQALLNQEKEQKLAQLIMIEETPQMQLNYIPLRFLEVISYLSYLSNRDEILDKVNKTNEVKQKFKVFQDLFNCNKDYSDSYMNSKKQEIELLRQRRSISIDNKQKQRITIRNFKDLNSFLSRMTVVPFDANQRRQQNQFQSEPIPLDYKERKQYVRSTTLQQEQSLTKLLVNKSEKSLKIPQHLLSLETMKSQQVSNLAEVDKSISKLLQQNEKIKTEITKNQFVISDRIKFFVDKAKEKYNLQQQQMLSDNNSKNQNYSLYKKQEKIKYPEINSKIAENQDQFRPNSTEKSNLKQNLDKYYSYFNRNSIKEKLKTIGYINEDNSEFNDHEISQNNLNSKSIHNIKDDLLPSECIQSINQINKIDEEKLKKCLGFQNFSKLIGKKIRYQTPPRIQIVYNKKVDNNTQQNQNLLQCQEQNKFNLNLQQNTQFNNQKINQYLEKVNQQKVNPTLATAKRIFGSSQSIKRHINNYSSTKLKNQNIIKGEQIPAKQIKLITKWIETVSVSQNENLQSELNM